MIKALHVGYTSAELQNVLAVCWTLNDLRKIFRVTGQTIHNWRNYRDLPALVIPGDQRAALRFIPHEVIQWSRDNDVKMYGVRILDGKDKARTTERCDT